MTSQPSPPKYSGEETIFSITQHYQFLTTLPYLPPSALILPPPDGWPNIPISALKARGKTDEVIELLRHLPYLDIAGDDWTIESGCTCIQYHRGNLYKEYTDGIKNLPGYVVPIGEMQDRNGSYRLLDTYTGCLTDYTILGGSLRTANRDHHETLPEKDKWKAFPTAPVRQFLGRWRKFYEKLVWMVAPDPFDDHTNCGIYFSRAGNEAEEDELLGSGDEDGGSGLEDEETAGVFEIYRRHGWPSDFKRDACQLELQSFLQA